MVPATKKESKTSSVNNALKSKVQKNPCSYMAATTTLKLIGSKWKVLILWKLLTEGKQRYHALHSDLGDISEKMLSQVLREMTQHGLIERTEVVTKAPKVVYYDITEYGKQLEGVLIEMVKFGERTVHMVSR